MLNAMRRRDVSSQSIRHAGEGYIGRVRVRIGRAKAVKKPRCRPLLSRRSRRLRVSRARAAPIASGARRPDHPRAWSPPSGRPPAEGTRRDASAGPGSSAIRLAVPDCGTAHGLRLRGFLPLPVSAAPTGRVCGYPTTRSSERTSGSPWSALRLSYWYPRGSPDQRPRSRVASNGPGAEEQPCDQINAFR